LRAFTLVELLVVIGIISVLVAILMPALNRVRAHAISTQCMSNLRQIGQVCQMYAAENKGFFPPSLVDSIESISGGTLISSPPLGNLPGHQVKQQFFKLCTGSTSVFYCPANDLWEGETATTTTAGTPPLVLAQHDPGRFEEYPTFADTSNVRIRYWYMGNPWRPSGVRSEPGGVDAGLDGFIQWLDVRPEPSGNGSRRDEYMCKVGEKNAAEICIATDQTRQRNGGWQFFHGPTKRIVDAAALGNTNSTAIQSGSWSSVWKNNLYGDGHVDRKRPDECFARWSLANPAAW